MSNWNPGEGLKKISFDEVQVGDEVRCVFLRGVSNENRVLNVSQGVVTEKTVSGNLLGGGSSEFLVGTDEDTIYLVNRPVMEEPKNLGDMVICSSDNEHVMIYIRLGRNDKLLSYPWLKFNWNGGRLLPTTGQCVSWKYISLFSPKPYTFPEGV